jgi:hypothetical protein
MRHPYRTTIFPGALFLLACSGRTAELIGPVDGGSAEAEAASEAAASEASDAPPLEGAGEASAMEATACEPLPSTVGHSAYACSSDPSGVNVVPRTFSWTQNGGTGCGWALTPTQCQCATSYNCACLRANNVCSSFGHPTWVWVDCAEASAVTVVCQEGP